MSTTATMNADITMTEATEMIVMTDTVIVTVDGLHQDSQELVPQVQAALDSQDPSQDQVQSFKLCQLVQQLNQHTIQFNTKSIVFHSQEKPRPTFHASLTFSPNLPHTTAAVPIIHTDTSNTMNTEVTTTETGKSRNASNLS